MTEKKTETVPLTSEKKKKNMHHKGLLNLT